MVQEKDAAKKRVAARQKFLDDHAAEMEKNTVRIKWQVIEHTPGYNTGGYYDTDVPAKHVVVADDFETEKAAQDWMDAHEPDEGNRLYILKRRLIRRESFSWI